MKKLLVLTVLTALTGAAFAKVDPSQPMVAGKRQRHRPPRPSHDHQPDQARRRQNR